MGEYLALHGWNIVEQKAKSWCPEPSQAKPIDAKQVRARSKVSIQANMLVSSEGLDDMQITNKGFQFLLQDVNTQVWAFLLQYLNMAEVYISKGSCDGIHLSF